MSVWEETGLDSSAACFTVIPIKYSYCVFVIQGKQMVWHVKAKAKICRNIFIPHSRWYCVQLTMQCEISVPLTSKWIKPDGNNSGDSLVALKVPSSQENLCDVQA